MGKRRTNATHKDRYNPDESEDEVEEENVQIEPLEESELANIKKRKKLIAKRVTNTESSSATTPKPFSMFAAKNDVTESQLPTTPAGSSVFSGFKGFGAYKPSAPVSTTSTTTSLFNGGSNISITKTSDDASLFKSDTVTPKPIQLPNGGHIKNTDEINDKKSIESKNLNDKELSFINGLNELFEKCYGENKRVYKIPTDIPLDTEKDSDTDKKKYAFLLAELNRHCSKWISKHVEENPLIILTPVFVDYFNYMIELEKSFFPDTFSRDKENKTVPQSITKPVGLLNGSLSTGSLFSFASKPSPEQEPQKLNGHKENSEKTFAFSGSTTQKFNGASTEPKKDFEEKKESDAKTETSSDEDEKETDKKLEDSSKTFASLIKTQTQPFTPSSTFAFKPFSTAEPEAVKETTKPTPQTAPAVPVPTSQSATTAPVTQTNPFSFFKLDQTAATSSPMTKLSFGTPSKPTEEKISNIETSNKFNLPLSSTITVNSTPSFKFGSPVAEEKKTDLAKFPASTANVLSSNSTTPSTTSNLFSFLNKPNTESPLLAPAQTPIVPNTATTTFSSLLNNQTTGSETVASKPFTGFASFQSSGSSTFTSSAPTSNPLITSTTTSFAGFQSLNKTSSLFGSASFGNAGNSTILGATTFGSNPITFGASAETGGEAGDDEPYEPPKPESNEIKEDGAVFSKKMKLYYFNDKEKKFADRGVGFLFLKPINQGEGTQLLVRADTKLANILLNVKLGKSLPINKDGPKSVSLICVPSPALPNMAENALCKFLFRVKTDEDAQELFDKLNELKK